MSSGVMTCQDPAKCGTGIKKGQQLKFTFNYSTGVAAATATWQAIKSDASKAGIDINLVGQSFNTIIGESAPCAPMGPKCNVQVFAYGGWAYDGPGFEPTGEPLFACGAGSNSGNYCNSTMDNLITDTHTNSSLSVFHNFATFTAQQLPYMWVPSPNPYQIIAVQTSCKTSSTTCCLPSSPSTGTSRSSWKQGRLLPAGTRAAAGLPDCGWPAPAEEI